MPCQSYSEPNEREIESKKVCQLLKYLFSAINISIDTDIVKRIEKGANEYYGDRMNLDANTKLLCDLLKKLPDETASKVMYDGRNPEARKLADWWDNHQIADAKREAEEKRSNEIFRLRAQALSKLTTEEIAALGIK